MRPELLTLVLVNLAGIMERADESLLPAVYKEVGEALHSDPTGLGSLTLFRSIVQAMCYPLAAYLASRHNRAIVIAYGAFLWSTATFLVAVSSTFFQVAISRALNGIGLAIVAPAIQSLVADSTNDSNRGLAFGWLQLTSNLGSIMGGLFSLSLAQHTVNGIPGWRISFYLVGIVSVAVGVVVRLFANDPRFSRGSMAESNNAAASSRSFHIQAEELIEEAKSVIRIPSFQIIVAQGVTGSFPWSALSFAPMWLELTGFSHKQTAFLIVMFIVANSLGGLFGGKMGDFLSERLPNTGRIILSQISSVSAIPFAAILLLVVPNNPFTPFLHGVVLFVTGFFISWNASATNNPIFAEIVPEKSRTSIYALDRSFESVLSSFAPPTVGILAQYVFGYKPIDEKGGSERIYRDRVNSAALAKALFVAIGIPMVLCVIIYSFLYVTYPRDRDRARREAVVEAEMQPGSSSSLEVTGSQYETGETKEIDADERSVIEMPFEGDDESDSDETDERSLIHRQLT